MAARRGKTQARRNNSNGLPGWAWLVLGILITLLVVIAAPRFLKGGDGDGFLRIGPKPNPDALPATVDENSDAIAPDVATNAPAATDKPKPTQYDFYTLLPGEEVKLSKRAGSYLSLRDLIDEAGRDATRWFLIARKPDSQLTFDIDLARSQSNDNPVYYVQYAHARVCSLLRQAGEKGFAYDAANGAASLQLLDDAPAQDLMRELSRYPEVVEAAGTTLEPHLVAQYLRELANAFHGWYHASPVLVDDAGLRDARLALALATRQVLANGLDLLGVSAPEKM